ncbi:uncharacterized protein LOC142176254 [Nicotiana tabacum]|uniref:Uncharacterized protein LOC142176254 n=1 Tax=Nicotiana tabacum TaxID=4097 RepID=A0AC58TQI5_TOBAC
MITEEQNERLYAEPTMEEVKAVVFGLNGDSTSGPEGFTGHFYQASWEIICEDVLNIVKGFFCGAELPKFIIHTNLVLLPKKKTVATFSDMRPINLTKSYPESIVENILLTQEIITDIRLRGKLSNVVIKLDMAKAYDSLMVVFDKGAKANGFFKSSREVKQGDPLSP